MSKKLWNLSRKRLKLKHHFFFLFKGLKEEKSEGLWPVNFRSLFQALEMVFFRAFKYNFCVAKGYYMMFL